MTSTLDSCSNDGLWTAALASSSTSSPISGASRSSVRAVATWLFRSLPYPNPRNTYVAQRAI